MPIFEYKCKKCSKQFDVLVLSSNDPEPECPECKCGDVTKLMSAGNIHSGSGGGYAPDFSGGGCPSSGGCAPSGGG